MARNNKDGVVPNMIMGQGFIHPYYRSVNTNAIPSLFFDSVFESGNLAISI